MMRKTYATLAALAAVLTAGCGHNSPTISAGMTPPGSSAPATPGAQSDSPLRPDPNLTPGATLDVSVADISVPGYTKKVRNVPEAVKRQVYAEYGIAHRQPGEYEVDHLISLELGGSNSIKNLWPQSYVTQPWNAHVKDDLENKLHDLVCSGQVPLATAQHDIATDWIAAYKKYFNTDQPLPSTGNFGHGRHRRSSAGDAPNASPSAATPAPPTTGGGTDQVWVNTRSGKYFRPGSPHYGHTKQGQYMTETQAQQQGYVAARG